MAKKSVILDRNKPIAMVKNDDGTVSTVRTISMNFGDGEVVIPTVHPDGYIMSNDEAALRYKETGEHFGKFKTVPEAVSFAEDLHNHQADIISEQKIYKNSTY